MPKHLLYAYYRVWSRLAIQQFQSQVANSRGAALLFLFGKLFRLGTAFLLLFVVVGRAKALAGYNLQEAILILSFFNLISSTTQMLFRGIYLFRQKVQDGTFDFYLLNPLSELFYALLSYADPLDAILFLPNLGLVIWAWVNSGFPLTIFGVLFVIACFIISELIVLSLHVVMIGVGVRYLEVDNTIMLYRDLEKMAAFPVSMYGNIGEFILTYIFPFALMATVPANLIFGLTSPWILLVFVAIAVLLLRFSLWFWRRSLLTYSSASS